MSDGGSAPPARPTVAACLARIGELWPDLAPIRARRLGAGWDCDVLVINEAYAFRFPRRLEVVPRLDAERAMLDIVRPVFPLPVPRIRFWAPPSPSWPFAFAGHELLIGTPAARVAISPARAQQVAGAIGAALGELHRMPIAATGAAAAVERVVLVHDLPALLAYAQRLYARLRLFLQPTVARRCEAFLATAPPAASDARCLVHGELTADNILLAPDGTIAGILDWTDAGPGDAAQDLAGLYHWGGPALLGAGLAAYPGASAALEARARFIGRCAGFIQLAAGIERERADQQASGLRALLWL